MGCTLVEVNTKMIAAEGISMDLWAGRLRQGEEKTPNPQHFFFFLCITEFKLGNSPLLFLDGHKYKPILKGTGKMRENWLVNSYWRQLCGLWDTILIYYWQVFCMFLDGSSYGDRLCTRCFDLQLHFSRFPIWIWIYVQNHHFNLFPEPKKDTKITCWGVSL